MFNFILDWVGTVNSLKDIDSWTFNKNYITLGCVSLVLLLRKQIKAKKKEQLEINRLKSEKAKVKESEKAAANIKLCRCIQAVAIIIWILLVVFNLDKPIKQFIKPDESKDIISADYICKKQRDRSIRELNSRQRSISIPASTPKPDMPQYPDPESEFEPKQTPEPTPKTDPEPERTSESTPTPKPSPTPTPKPLPTPTPEIPDEDSVDLTF